MSNIEVQYLEAMKEILFSGEEKEDRTGTGTFSLFGKTLTHDFKNGFPLFTSKKIHYKSVIHELLWFISGNTNISYLKENDVRIWDEWADKEGNLGPVYGKQLRDCAGVDQLKNVVDSIKNNPTSRRHVISLWHPPDLYKMALPPCHGLAIQFNVHGDYLDLATYQRSADWFLGVPFNIASYSFLLQMICHITDHHPGKLIYNFGDAHIYKNHIEQCVQQLRNANQSPKSLPQLNLLMNPDKEIQEFKFEDFELIDYYPNPTIKAKVSV